MADDTMMTAAARKVLVSNWFDVSLVRVKCVRGVVTLQGHLEKTAGEKVTYQQLEASLKKMDDNLRALRGFRGVAYLIDNWRRDGSGGWQFTGSRRDLEQLRGR